MNLLAIARTYLCVLCFVHCAAAQQVGNLDLRDTTPQGFAVKESGVGSGSCGSVGPLPDAARARVIEVQLVSIDPLLIAFGDKLDFTVRLTNIGHADVRIPWTSNASNVEIPGATRYQYVTLTPSISLEVENTLDDPSRGEWDHLLGLELYAKSLRSSATKLLRRGEWVEIQYRRNFVSYNANISELVAETGQLRFRATGAALLTDVTRTLAADKQSARTHSACSGEIKFVSAGEFILTVIPRSVESDVPTD